MKETIMKTAMKILLTIIYIITISIDIMIIFFEEINWKTILIMIVCTVIAFFSIRKVSSYE